MALKLPRHFEPYPEAIPYDLPVQTEAEPIPDLGVPGGITGPNGKYPKNPDFEPEEEDEEDDE